MSDTGFIIARVLVAVCILAYILPGIFRRGMTLPTMGRYLVIWIGIGAAIAVAYDLWKG